MTTWIKTDDGLESEINGWVYLIEKTGTTYSVWTEGEVIARGCVALDDAKRRAELDAQMNAECEEPPATRDGVHLDAIAGQQLVDILKRSFTTAQIQDLIDASPYDEPDTGAPEGGPVG